jgi:hypothetical protein
MDTPFPGQWNPLTRQFEPPSQNIMSEIPPFAGHVELRPVTPEPIRGGLVPDIFPPPILNGAASLREDDARLRQRQRAILAQLLRGKAPPLPGNLGFHLGDERLYSEPCFLWKAVIHG